MDFGFISMLANKSAIPLQLAIRQIGENLLYMEERGLWYVHAGIH